MKKAADPWTFPEDKSWVGAVPPAVDSASQSAHSNHVWALAPTVGKTNSVAFNEMIGVGAETMESALCV